MDELISRRAAIDAVGEVHPLDYNAQSTVNRIKKIPSAQEWIPCSERLPEYDGDAYLVTDYCEQINRRRVHISYCYINREGFWSDVPLGYKVIAWMPLPEPPKEEEGE